MMIKTGIYPLSSNFWYDPLLFLSNKDIVLKMTEMLEYLQYNPLLFACLIALLGLMVGSFLNVVIYRYPKMLNSQWKNECCEFLSEQSKNFSSPFNEKEEKTFNLSSPGSHCTHCQHAIPFYHNIPLISWLLLKGQCAFCKTKISIRYPLIEGLTGILSFSCAIHFGVGLQSMFILFLLWSLIALSLIDYDTQLLPDDITLPILWLGLAGSFFTFSLVDTQTALLGAMFGYGFLWIVFHLFRLVTGKEGMGYGDFKLFALLGAWQGWEMLPAILLISTFVGAIIGVGLILLKKKDTSKPIPFGPYLSIAGLITLFFGHDINTWYLTSMGLV